MRYLKQTLACLAFISPLFSANVSAATELKGCAAKEQQIQQQIDYANQHGNRQRIAGLEKALEEVRQNCTDERLTQERKAKIAEKESKVNERIAELDAARETGNPDKIKKKEKKVQEARDELLEAQEELNK